LNNSPVPFNVSSMASAYSQLTVSPRRRWLLPCTALFLISALAFSQDVPQNFEDLSAAATAAREQNDIPRAITLYEQAVKLKPDWPDGWWFLGFLQYGTSDYASARDAISHYIELTPHAAPALALRGLCEFETGEYPQSLQDIQVALSLGAANKSRNEQILRYHEALLLTRTGRFEDAVSAYGYFASKGIDDPEMLVGLGLAGLRNPLLPKDVSAQQRELLLAAGTAAFRFLAGDEATAHQDFEQLFQHFPSAANAHYFYGYLLFAKDPDSAAEEFKKELEVSPASASAHTMLAWSFLIQNNPAGALPFARKAAGEEPSKASTQLVLGRSLTETGDLKSGVEHLEKALQTEPDNLEIHIALAQAYSRSGRKDDARRERLLCLQLTQPNPGAESKTESGPDANPTSNR
jgi:tetratricopeptide (TPR) repeat protein